MQLSLKNYDVKITIEDNDDLSTDEMFEHFISLLISGGWSQGCINQYIIEKAQDLLEYKKN